jgi:hypothetical protein
MTSKQYKGWVALAQAIIDKGMQCNDTNFLNSKWHKQLQLLIKLGTLCYTGDMLEGHV